jgi:hypothetical protein
MLVNQKLQRQATARTKVLENDVTTLQDENEGLKTHVVQLQQQKCEHWHCRLQ